VPASAGSVGAVLRENGFNTSWFGKMHNVPDWMSSQAGPFDLWPNGLGFEYFYGFLGGDSDIGSFLKGTKSRQRLARQLNSSIVG
jgi:arylsulfatase A-like enzyme